MTIMLCIASGIVIGIALFAWLLRSAIGEAIGRGLGW